MSARRETPQHHAHFHGPVYGAVVGHDNTVTIATTEDARAAGAGDPLAGLPRLGDDRAGRLAVEVLRVHQAITLPAGTSHDGLDPDLPNWVDRDLGPQLRGWLESAKDTGGFLTIVGGSSTGKTRLLYETAREVLRGWPVLAPVLGDGAPINELARRAGDLPEGVVVWLDELYRFLPGPGLSSMSTPVTATAIARLLDAPATVILLGSLWPTHLADLTATHESPTGAVDHLYPDAADALRGATLLTLEAFNTSETAAARASAAVDPRLATALRDLHFGLTEALAGARRLVERYETAIGPARGVLLAAIDAQRLGLPPPLELALLSDAARGHLDEAYPTDNWAPPALAELSRRRGPSDRGTSPLLAHYDTTHHKVVGYEVADYLLQHASCTRRSVPIPDATWQALAQHTNDSTLLNRLADSAKRRGLDHHAIAIYTKAGDTRHLFNLLAERGDVEELRGRADAGDHIAAEHIIEALAKRGDVDGLRALADAGEHRAALSLAELLAERGEVDELRALADAGDLMAALRLAKLLAEWGEVDELRARADTDPFATQRRGQLLLDGDELLASLPAHSAALCLAELLAERGDVDELRARADAGDHTAAEPLIELLAERGDVEELRGRADAGDHTAAEHIIEALAKRGDVDGLRALADAGDHLAALTLAEVLAERGDVEELRGRADAGDYGAALSLVHLLAERGDVEELRARADAGDHTAAEHLIEVLAKRGDLAPLRARADARDRWAVKHLVELLVEREDLVALRAEVDAGTPGALAALRELEAGSRGMADSWCGSATRGRR